MISVNEIRQMFPLLSRQIYGKQLIYFDNAATSQRPQSVLDLWNRLSTQSNANIHRGIHRLSEEATAEYENTRDYVRQFLNAQHREEIVFTSGTTAAINLVAFSFGEAFVGEGDEVIVSEVEHHSDIVPWQMMCQRKKAVLKVLKVDDSGHLMVDSLNSLITERTKIVAVTQISNVLGIVNPIDRIVEICHSKGVPVLVDGAQGIVHHGMDVTKTDCDFYAFSGHKIYAATGVGVLYGKKKWLDMMPPYMGGGEMISTVKFSGTTYAQLPEKFEAGTQNFTGVPTLRLAIEMALMMRDESLTKYCDGVKEYLMEELMKDERITLYGIPSSMEEKIPLFSISVKGAHHEDLALILDKMGIAARSGQMCAEPCMDRFGVTGMLRLSLAPYNTMEEAEYFIKSLDKAVKMLQ